MRRAPFPLSAGALPLLPLLLSTLATNAQGLPQEVEQPVVSTSDTVGGAERMALDVRVPTNVEERVIPPGQEQRIVQLIAPHAMGDTIDGWTIGDIAIDREEIRFQLRSGELDAELLLRHPKSAPGDAARSRNFALIRRCAGSCPEGVMGRLEAAIGENDQGVFWKQLGPSPARRAAQAGLSQLKTTFDDGVLQLLFGLLLLCVVLWRQLSDAPKWVLPSLVGVVLLGALVRWILPVESLMTAWPYERVPPLVDAMWKGRLLPWFTSISGWSIGLQDLIFETNFLLAVLTPLAVFAHARYLLGDVRMAVAAALLLAILPMHIRFSRSDVLMIQSLATASLTFVVIYTSLLDRSRWVRLGFLVLIPALSLATYHVRPENFALVLLDLAVVYIVADKGVPLRRQLLVGSVVGLTGLYGFFTRFIVANSDQVARGMGLENLLDAFETLVDPRLNTFTNLFATPPWILLLALLGAGWLWRNGERKRTVFIVLWFCGYLFIHSIARGHLIALQARYHLQLVTPFLMLAAAATPLVLGWTRRRQAVLAGLLLLSPPLYSGFIRDVNFYEMEEFLFLREASARIPDGCTVLEFSPAYEREKPEETAPSRLNRLALRMEGGMETGRFHVLNAGVLREGALQEELTRQAHDILGAPPPCLVAYEGLTCRSHRPAEEEIAPVCDAMRVRLAVAETLGTTTYTARDFDGPFLGRILSAPSGKRWFEFGIHPGDAVSLRLYRATGTEVVAEEEG